MTQFPNSPSVGDRVTFSNATYEWDGSRWKSLGSISVGPTGATGPAGSGGGGVSAGAGLTLAGSTLGIDPTAVVHVAGVSSDGGVTASNVHSVGLISGGAGINLSAGYLEMANGSRMGNAANGVFRVATNELQLLPNTDTTNAFVVASTLHYHNQKTQFKKGISADMGIELGTGITFPDGTHQTSAASGSGVTAGAGMTLAGSTLGIDPTAVVHVAGISSDGGITAGGNITTTNGSIIIPNGQYIYNNQSSTLRPSIRLATSEVIIDSKSSGTPGRLIVGNSEVKTRFVPFVSEQLVNAQAGISSDGSIAIPAGNSYGWSDGSFITTASGALRFSANSGYFGVQLSSSIFSVYRDAFFEDGVHVAGAAGISADKGIKLGGGITFSDGTHQTSAASGSTITAGAGMTLAGSTLGIDPTANIHVAGISSDGGATFDGIVYANRFMGYGNSNTGVLVGGVGLNNFYINTSGASRMKVQSNAVIAYVKLQADALIHAKAGISMDAAGITFPDGTHQTSAASGSTITAGAGMTLNGSTLGIDPTAVVHVAGISADGGITAGSGKIGRITFDDNAIRLVNGASVINTSGAWTYYGTSELGLFPNGSSNQGLSITTARTKAFQVIHAVGGISADAGITFPDGTHQTSAAPRTSSYTGHIEEASIKEYTLDPVAATARTITGFYIQSGNQSGSGGGSGTFILKVKSGGSEVTVKSVAVDNSSGAQSSLANTSVAADARIFLHCTATSSAVDVVFSVEYSL